jgi:hypothetical protein
VLLVLSAEQLDRGQHQSPLDHEYRGQSSVYPSQLSQQYALPSRGQRSAVRGVQEVLQEVQFSKILNGLLWKVRSLGAVVECGGQPSEDVSELSSQGLVRKGLPPGG